VHSTASDHRNEISFGCTLPDPGTLADVYLAIAGFGSVPLTSRASRNTAAARRIADTLESNNPPS
jgi:hypothetical protein